MKNPQKIFGYALVMNLIGAMLSFGIGLKHDAGGGSLGYVIVGFAITGLITLLITLIFVIVFFNRVFKYKFQNGIAIFLAILCLWEISFLRLLASVDTLIDQIFK